MSPKSRERILCLSLTWLTGLCLQFGPLMSQTKYHHYKLRGNPIYPSALAVDPQDGDLYLGNVKEGSIYLIRDGMSYYFKYEAEDGLISPISLKVHVPNQELWVCNADFGYSRHSNFLSRKRAYLMAFDLKTGKLKTRVPLPSGLYRFYLGCSITVNKNGLLYVTDTYSPVLYVVDPKVGLLETCLKDARMQGGVNILGILPNDFILIFNKTSKKLYRVCLVEKQWYEIAWKTQGPSNSLHGVKVLDDKRIISICDGKLVVLGLQEQASLVEINELPPWEEELGKINYPMCVDADERGVYYLDGTRENIIKTDAAIQKHEGRVVRIAEISLDIWDSRNKKE